MSSQLRARKREGKKSKGLGEASELTDEATERQRRALMDQLERLHTEASRKCAKQADVDTNSKPLVAADVCMYDHCLQRQGQFPNLTFFEIRCCRQVVSKTERLRGDFREENGVVHYVRHVHRF